MKANRLAWIAFVSLAVVAGAGCGETPASQAGPTPLPVVADLSGITAEGRLEPVRYVSLAPTVDGLVSEVLVREGEQVQAGQLIARIDGAHALTLESAQASIALELSSAHQAVRTAQDELDAYRLPRIFVGLTAEQAARTWLTELDAAMEAFAPYRDSSRKALKPRHAFPNRVYPGLPGRVLYDTGEYDGLALEYKKRVDAARANYTRAVQWLQLDSALAAAQARLSDAQKRYDRLNDQALAYASAGTVAALATAEIRAPFSGTITQLDLEVGEAAGAGIGAVTVADFSGWIVKTTDLTEIDVVSIKEGMPVRVILDSLPDTEFGGSVLHVDLGYTDRQGDIVYPVDVLLGGSNAGLRWGMTAEVTFEE
jgi:multidrug resistance efflux pump